MLWVPVCKRIRRSANFAKIQKNNSPFGSSINHLLFKKHIKVNFPSPLFFLLVFLCLFQPCTHFAQSFNRESNGDSDVGGGRVLKEGRFYTPWGYLEGGSVLGQQAGGGGCGVGSRCLKARNQKPKLQGTFPMAQTRTPPPEGVCLHRAALATPLLGGKNSRKKTDS